MFKVKISSTVWNLKSFASKQFYSCMKVKTKAEICDQFCLSLSVCLSRLTYFKTVGQGIWPRERQKYPFGSISV